MIGYKSWTKNLNRPFEIVFIENKNLVQKTQNKFFVAVTAAVKQKQHILP